MVNFFKGQEPTPFMKHPLPKFLFSGHAASCGRQLNKNFVEGCLFCQRGSKALISPELYYSYLWLVMWTQKVNFWIKVQSNQFQYEFLIQLKYLVNQNSYKKMVDNSKSIVNDCSQGMNGMMKCDLMTPQYFFNI